jgi:phage portal protein BeeE
MRFTVADISRFYGVPLHLLNETDKSTSWGSGISRAIAWVPDIQH